MEENRKFVRIEWPVVIKYKTIEEPSAQDQIVGKDISEGGARFIVYERLTKGTKLDFQLEVPFDPMPISAKGEVAWIKKIGDEDAKTFEVGVIFKGLSQNDQKRLKMYIENEIKERRKT
ncbi:MAG: PilZ domain-containing protein [Candidatus Omnitrophota bacterium]|nr:PilZ domain-containing protein [Candidatus Omnitrophota bacterium]